MREFVLSSHEAEKSELERLGHCVANDETPRNHLRARIAQLEEVIGPAIAEDLDAPVDDPHTQVVAASLAAAFTLLSERSTDSSPKQKSADDITAAIDPVITCLRGGLEALKAPSTTRRR